MTSLQLGDAGDLARMELLDHASTEWARVRETSYLVHQLLRYDYPGPIRDLRQRLVLIPPAAHVDQRRVLHRLDVSVPGDCAVATDRIMAEHDRIDVLCNNAGVGATGDVVATELASVTPVDYAALASDALDPDQHRDRALMLIVRQ